MPDKKKNPRKPTYRPGYSNPITYADDSSYSYESSSSSSGSDTSSSSPSSSCD